MAYYEVLIADGRYRGDKALTYSSDEPLEKYLLVSVPLRGYMVNGFVQKKVRKPSFDVKPIKISQGTSLPPHLIDLARWVSQYWACSLGDSLRLFAPTGVASRRTIKQAASGREAPNLALDHKPNRAQTRVINEVKKSSASTILLHGETGSGKTRIYLQLAADTLAEGRSVIILTPEIALTPQLAIAAKRFLSARVYVLHSQLSASSRKKVWLEIARSTDPVVVIGPRSALFSPVRDPGLIIVDEAHEPAYKQDQAPRYHASRVASQLARLTGAKTILGSATPSITDYYLAQNHNAIVRIKRLAAGKNPEKKEMKVVDLTEVNIFSKVQAVSRPLLRAITDTLNADRQVLLYLNRRGSARSILCANCGWHLTCPNCDISMIYHADEHKVRCHTCGYTQRPPASCPSCHGNNILYKTAGTKALAESLMSFFPNKRINRFDSDSLSGERVHELYHKMAKGSIDIMIGTQLLAKGLDLPKLGLVGIIAADSSWGMPDFTASERAFQLTTQVVGRVGRGHGPGSVIVQTYDPNNIVIKTALKKDWATFYKNTLDERQKFGFPPFVFLLKMTCKRATNSGAQRAANNLKSKLLKYGLPVEIIGPAPCFYNKRYGSYYWQVVVKSKQRQSLVKLASECGGDCTVDLDPSDLL